MFERLALRPLQVSDAADMSEVLSDPELYRFTGGHPPTTGELERRYAVQTRGGSPAGLEIWINELVVVRTDSGERPVGFVQATIPVDTGPTEIAWVIGVPWQGNGYGHRAASLLMEQLRERGITDVIVHILPDHTASQRIAQRLAMEPTDITIDGETLWKGTTPEPTRG